MKSFVVSTQYWPNLPFNIASNIYYDREKYLSHTHGFYEFFMIAEGALQHRKNGVESLMSRRSLCFMYPEDEHELQNSPVSEKVHIVNCTFSAEFFQETEAFLLRDLKNRPVTWSKTLGNIPSRNWQGLLEKTNILQFHRNAYSLEAQSALFRSLLYDVMFLLAEPERPMSADIPDWLSAACEKMQKGDNFVVGLPRFIELSGKSQEHLTRSMSKYYGETPTAYINVLRIRKAAQELLYSRKDIWDIMYDCGFNNYAYFLKCFRENFSMTPKQYIQLNKRTFSRREAQK